jgi:exonuclease III
MGERTFVWVYVPSSRFEPETDRSVVRKEWNEALNKHCMVIQNHKETSPFVMGDLNMAPTTLDCFQNVSRDPTFPSTTPLERMAFTYLLSSLDSVDVYVTLQPGCQTVQSKGKVDVSHFSW